MPSHADRELARERLWLTHARSRRVAVYLLGAAALVILTRGIDLNALVGVRFRVGDVECAGVELVAGLRGCRATSASPCPG
mgnify:CR=1 FL=1